MSDTTDACGETLTTKIRVHFVSCLQLLAEQYLILSLIRGLQSQIFHPVVDVMIYEKTFE